MEDSPLLHPALQRLRLTISWPAVVPIVAALLVAVALAGAGTPLSTAASSGSPALASGAPSADLAALAAREPARAVEVIVQLQPGADVAAVRDRIALSGGDVFRAVPLINGLAAHMKAADAAALSHSSGVRAVSLNAQVVSQGTIDASKLQSAYNQSIRADKAWDAGYKGKGIGVAVIDSGLAGNLPDFRRSDSDRSSRGI